LLLPIFLYHFVAHSLRWKLQLLQEARIQPSLTMLAMMPSDKRLRNMRSFHRQSTTEEFVLSPESPLPDVTTGGARVKVYILPRY